MKASTEVQELTDYELIDLYEYEGHISLVLRSEVGRELVKRGYKILAVAR